MNKLLTLVFLLFTTLAQAAVYPMPAKGDEIVGKLQQARIKFGDNFHTIGRRYDIGFDAMALANPKFSSTELPIFYKVVVPSQFILPPGKHQGIVINLPEMRLYYYLPNHKTVMTYPIGIGLVGSPTPQGDLHIIQKIKNPTWVVPPDIQKELAAKGIKVPDKVLPGPTDPLGDFALRLSQPTYLIHGTDYPPSIGTRASSGCIRLFAEDIQSLFGAVTKGTQVRIIDDPYKVGWAKGRLYLSAYPPLVEDQKKVGANLTPMVTEIDNAVAKTHVKVNWQKAIAIALQHNGIPQPISSKIS